MSVESGVVTTLDGALLVIELRQNGTSHDRCNHKGIRTRDRFRRWPTVPRQMPTSALPNTDVWRILGHVGDKQ